MDYKQCLLGEFKLLIKNWFVADWEDYIRVIEKDNSAKDYFESYCLSKVFIDRYWTSFWDIEMDIESCFLCKIKVIDKKLLFFLTYWNSFVYIMMSQLKLFY